MLHITERTSVAVIYFPAVGIELKKNRPHKTSQ